jgi:hypothetical protein
MAQTPRRGRRTGAGRREARLLRELAGRAYEIELAELTEELAASFDEWRAGEIGVVDLNDWVHESHDGDARELWKRYNYVAETTLVDRRALDAAGQRQPRGDAQRGEITLV